MNGNLSQLGNDLHLHLFRLQRSLNNITDLFTGEVLATSAEFASRLDDLDKTAREYEDRTSVLHLAFRNGLEQEAAHTPDTLSRWMDRRQTAQLHARADQIAQLAAIAVELAALSTLKAERMTMTAILTRRQAVSLQVQRGDSS